MELLVLSLTLVVLLCIRYAYQLKLWRNLPPGPIKLPFIGNSSLLKRYSVKYGGLHNALEKLSAVHKTDILWLKLGGENVVIVQDQQLIEEVCTRDEFQGRPDTFFIRLRSMGTRKGITMTDGPLWHEQRAFAVKHMHNIGLGRSPMEYMIQEEIQNLFSSLKEGASSIQLRKYISKCVLNVLWAMVTGSRFKDESKLEGLISYMEERARAFDMAGGVLCQFPWVRFIAPEKSGFQLINRLNASFKNMIMGTINEHKETYSEDVTRDFIDAFLHAMYKNDRPDSTFTDDQLIMVCLDFFIAGSQTTSSTLDFAILRMLLNPEAQAKVQAELDSVYGRTATIPSVCDRLRLPMVEATLMEVQRISQTVPVIGPRRVLEDTTLGGYFIPKETTVLMNLVPMAKDPQKWTTPDLFCPERFLDEEGCHKSLIHEKNMFSFGKGKRRCPGEALAKNFMFIFFAAFLHRYKIEPVTAGDSPPTQPIPGITMSPQPYSIKLTKR